VGDEILIQLSQVIVNSTRSADLVARYGGEEFVVLMPETDFEAAYDVAERIRRTVEAHVFNVSHEVGILKKTISIGVATLNHQYDTPERLLKRADNALYVSKDAGRNQVNPKTNPMEEVPVEAPPVSVEGASEMPAPKERRSLDLHTAGDDGLPVTQDASAPAGGRMLNTNLMPEYGTPEPQTYAPAPVTPPSPAPQPSAPAAGAQTYAPLQPSAQPAPQPSQPAAAPAGNPLHSDDDRKPVIYELNRPARTRPAVKEAHLDDEPPGTF
jgi:hypothetical protein